MFPIDFQKYQCDEPQYENLNHLPWCTRKAFKHGLYDRFIWYGVYQRVPNHTVGIILLIIQLYCFPGVRQLIKKGSSESYDRDSADDANKYRTNQNSRRHTTLAVRSLKICTTYNK